MQKHYKYFHYLSFIQYPFLIIGLYYSFKPHIYGLDTIWEDLNHCLIFMGTALSFAAFADVTKQNKWSKKIFGNPKLLNAWFIYLIILIGVILACGIYALLFTEITALKELATGIIVLAIGVIGLLKMSIEAGQHHLNTIENDVDTNGKII